MNKPKSCSGCPLEFESTGYVSPTGPKSAKIYLVNEQPTLSDVAKGKSFQEGTGRILNRLLKTASIDRNECRTDNVIRCHVKGKLSKKFDPIECASRHLFEDLKVVKPHITIAFGERALQTLTGLDKIGKRRGSLYKGAFSKVIPTLHPLTLMRNQTMIAVVCADLIKAKRESLFKEFLPVKQDFNKFPTLADLKAFSPSITEPLACDIETTWAKYWENALICVGFATLNNGTLCIPWLKCGGGKYWKEEEQEAVVVEIQRLLSHPTIYQNGFFDIQVLEAIGFHVKNYTFDTLLAHHLLYSELPHDLGFICSMHTPIPYYKDESKSDAGALQISDTIFRGYNCKDAYSTILAARDLMGDLRQHNIYDHFRAVTMKLPRILLDMQKRGILVDTHTLRKAIIEYTVMTKQLDVDMEKLGIPKGTKALKEYLFVELALPIVKRTKTRAPSLDKDAFEKLQNRIIVERDKLPQDCPRFATLNKAEVALNLIGQKTTNQKILSTYLRGLPIGNDGRVHCSWLQHGTKNQRLSSREPNLQNIPQKGIAKRIYVAKPGHEFYFLDYSQIELRIIAYVANDTPLIDAFENGQDVHDLAARDLFGLGKNEVVSKEIRTFTKSCEYCWNYGGDIVAVLRVHPGVLSLKDAKRAQKIYFEKRPALKLFREAIEVEVKTTKAVANPFGLKRLFFGSISETIRSAYNTPIQSGAAHVINTACIRLYNKGLTSGLILQIHDALGFELSNDKNVAEIKQVMEMPVYIKGHKVAMPVDVEVGRTWDTLTKYKPRIESKS